MMAWIAGYIMIGVFVMLICVAVDNEIVTGPIEGIGVIVVWPLAAVVIGQMGVQALLKKMREK